MLVWWPSVISVITLHVDMVAVRQPDSHLIVIHADDRTNGVRNLRRTDVVAVRQPDSHYPILWMVILFANGISFQPWNGLFFMRKNAKNGTFHYFFARKW